MAETRTFEIAQYRDKGDPITEQESRGLARQMLNDKAREYGLIVSAVTGDDEVPVMLNAEMTGWTEVAPGEEHSGYVRMWRAPGIEPERDPDPLPGGTRTGDAYTVAVPEEVTDLGGSVRVRHHLGGPVTVSTTVPEGDGHRILLSMPITDDEEHIELHAGVTHVTCTLDYPPNDQ